MKIFNLFLFLFTMSLQANPIVGEWTSKTQDNIRTDHFPVRVYVQKINYSKGGIIINYPDNYFFNDPFVYISIELNQSDYSSSVTFTPLITAKDENSVTIKVNKLAKGLLLSSVAEADDDEITVHVFSCGT